MLPRKEFLYRSFSRPATFAMRRDRLHAGWREAK